MIKLALHQKQTVSVTTALFNAIPGMERDYECQHNGPRTPETHNIGGYSFKNRKALNEYLLDFANSCLELVNMDMIKNAKSSYNSKLFKITET